MKVKWERSEDGYVDSKCGRFSVKPLHAGRVNPIWFVGTDNQAVANKEQYTNSSYCNTQKEAKAWCQVRVDREENQS